MFMSEHLDARTCRGVMCATQFVLLLLIVLFTERAAIAVTTVELGDLGGGFSQAVAVNASGQVAGVSANLAGQTRAFSWTQAGGMVELTLGGHSEATAVNDSGQVVGWSNDASDPPSTTHAFLWTQAGGMIDLGDLGAGFSEARAVNANGQVVGRSTRASDSATHAFSWTQAGGMIDLGTLLAAPTARLGR
jgi:probable HAF family extracellular repeat protein